MLASQEGHEGCVQALLAVDANKDALESTCGSTALMNAAIKGRDGCVRLLVKAGADRSIKSNSKGGGKTALEYANTEVVKAILRS